MPPTPPSPFLAPHACGTWTLAVPVRFAGPPDGIPTVETSGYLHNGDPFRDTNEGLGNGIRGGKDKSMELKVEIMAKKIEPVAWTPN